MGLRSKSLVFAGEGGLYADRFRHHGYRFYFYSHEPNEPSHIHVDQGDKSAKFWLLPVALARNFGYNAKELNELMDLVDAHQSKFLGAWNEHFGQ